MPTSSGSAEAHMRSFPFLSVDSLPSLAPAILRGSSFFEGTALFIVNKPCRRVGKRCRVVVTSVMTPPSTNVQRRTVDITEESGDMGALKSNDEELPETPQLELRKPGHVVDRVVKSVVKEVHHVELPAIRLNVRPKVQVRDSGFICTIVETSFGCL